MEKRTENEIFKDFENVGYRIEKNRTKFADSENSISLLFEINYPDDDINLIKEIDIDLTYKVYTCYEFYGGRPLSLLMHEHKLLNELFELWGWV